MATRFAQTDADMREAELNDALTSAFSVPEVGDFLKELQAEVSYAATQAVNDKVGSWINQTWPRLVRIIVQRLREEYIISDDQRQQMEQLGLAMADSVLDSLVQEVEDALAENLPAYGVQDILDSAETEFLRILNEGERQ